MENLVSQECHSMAVRGQSTPQAQPPTPCVTLHGVQTQPISGNAAGACTHMTVPKGYSRGAAAVATDIASGIAAKP